MRARRPISGGIGVCPVLFCAEVLGESSVTVGTVVGFPPHTTATKVFEAEKAVIDGATELDMVINIGWLVSGELTAVEEDIRAVVRPQRERRS